MATIARTTPLTKKQVRTLKAKLQLMTNHPKINRLPKEKQIHIVIKILNYLIKGYGKEFTVSQLNIDIFRTKTIKQLYAELGVEDLITRYKDLFEKIHNNIIKIINDHLSVNRDLLFSSLINQIQIGSLLGDAYVKGNNALVNLSPNNFSKYRRSIAFFRKLRSKYKLLSLKQIRNLFSEFEEAVRTINSSSLTYLAIRNAYQGKFWLQTLQETFVSEGISCSLNEQKSFDEDGKIKIVLEFVTVSTLQYNELCKKWYPKGKKIVPRDIELTPTTCLVWLFDDGSTTSDRIFLYTMGFLKQDVFFLAEKLQNLGFEARVEKKKLSAEDITKVDPLTYKERYWIIVLGKKGNVNKFLDYCQEGHPLLVEVMKQYYPYKLSLDLKKSTFFES